MKNETRSQAGVSRTRSRSYEERLPPVHASIVRRIYLFLAKNLKKIKNSAKVFLENADAAFPTFPVSNKKRLRSRNKKCMIRKRGRSGLRNRSLFQ